MSNATLPRGFRAATAADVRAWAGIPTRRGRLSTEVVEGFNAAHSTGKGRMRYVGPQPQTVTLEAKPEKGRKVRRTATIAEVRQWATDNGYEVGARGRLSAEVKSAFVLAQPANA